MYGHHRSIDEDAASQDLEVKRSTYESCGEGLFAKKDFQIGEPLATYWGRFHKRSPDHCHEVMSSVSVDN